MSEKRIVVWTQHFKDRPQLVLQWLDPDTGKRKSKSAGTADPKEAERARADLESDLNNGRHKEASRMSWEAFRDLFEAEFLPGKRAATQTIYRATFDQFERLVNPRSLRGITERTISLYVAALRKEPGRGHKGATMMASSIHVRLQFLHTALVWAAEQKMLPEPPRFPAVKVPKKRPQAVPTESFERIIDIAPDAETRAYLLCGWLAGLRLTEAFELEWEPTDRAPWVDLLRNRIVLPAELVKAVEDQWVAIDPQLREALQALPRQGAKVFNFIGARGPLSASGMSQRVRTLAQKAGVRLTMKTLRRGFGCRYAGKVPAQVLQKLMRHANIKTTMDYYANVDAAAEAAILGNQKEQRNTSRNTSPNERVTDNTAANASAYRVDLNDSSSC